MVNAWSLAYDILNGTLDEDYPIMNKEKKEEEVVVVIGGDNTITSLESDEYDPIITTSKEEEIFTVPSPFNDDTLNIGLNTASADEDTITFGDSDSIDLTGLATGIDLGDYNIDVGGIDLGDYGANAGGIDFGDIGSLSDTAETFNINIGSSGTAYDDPKYYATKPQPDLNYKSQKYQEDKGIADLKDYVSSTYRGHYTNKNSDTQTLDLIHSVGDAESFCRSNALKYLSRYDKKGSAKQDILKAMHYCLLLYYFSGNTQEPDTTNTRYETF
jgi:hypothetical protein